MLIHTQYLTALCHLLLLNILALMVPGPDFYTVVRNSLRNGRVGGIATAMGICISECCHLTYITLGAATFIKNHTWVLPLIKIAGSLYLLHLGIALLRHNSHNGKTTPTYATPSPSSQHLASFRIGFLCNITNPKAIVFYISLFSVAVDAHTPVPILFLYGSGLIITTFLWFMLVATVFTSELMQRRLQHFTPFIEKITGIILIIISIKLAVSTEY